MPNQYDFRPNASPRSSKRAVVPFISVASRTLLVILLATCARAHIRQTHQSRGLKLAALHGGNTPTRRDVNPSARRWPRRKLTAIQSGIISCARNTQTRVWGTGVVGGLCENSCFQNLHWWRTPGPQSLSPRTGEAKEHRTLWKHLICAEWK